MPEKIVLVGGGGHCKVVISVLKESGNFEIVGISDLKGNLEKEILGIPVKFTDDDLPFLFKEGVKNALVTIGSVGNPEKRVKLFEYLKSIGFKLPVVISKHAIVKENVTIEEGTIVMPGAIINPGTKIGKNVIINTGSIIEHDCVIGDHVHVAPGAVLSGGVIVDSETHIGAGAVIIQNIRIGKKTIIGAGAVVVRDIPDMVVAKGVPARY
ncbi:sugar O-acyltransferase, sialic acid O-acetyltransferase NeuD family [Thermotoga petrophila RKU-10]|jgi:UDP-perosamine 4-acetyltransferase|uniref:Sugar O-acyltransferase, sialic acid O-acetyltransferase NeuD family n=1 Tax=Thermotoga petrophila (strain ATCC BAA-489 / DSM 13996 / JCM 10882 / RKU-10) TaxID=590168 RepID=D2C6D2_THEP2|nr:acetyltransferase [Thermotoga petrophila]ADA66518.1 sugar O-acyltransferase, sialic acid O-acetyltransferase NeuD family [Thermotoga petrophila RKU-10]